MNSTLIGELENVKDDLAKNRQSEQTWEHYKRLVIKGKDSLKAKSISSSESEQKLLEKIKNQLENAALLLEQNKKTELELLLQEKIPLTLEQIREEFEAKNISIKEVFRDYSAFKAEFPNIEDDKLNTFFGLWKERINNAMETIGVAQIDMSKCHSITQESASVKSKMLEQCNSEIGKLDLSKRDEAKKLLTDYMNELTSEVGKHLASAKDGIMDSERRVSQFIQEISKLKLIQEQRMLEIEKGKGRMSQEEMPFASTVMLIGFTVIAIFILVTVKAMVNYPLFLELATVFILAIIILILGLASKLDGPALAALIGGMSGYVLGRLEVKPSSTCKYPEPPPSDQARQASAKAPS